MTLIDLTGVEFENLTVLYRSEDMIKDGKRRRVRWHCRCRCGNEFDVIADNLRQRPNMTCNECVNKRRSEHNRIDVVGKKYGRLTIVEVVVNTRPTKVKCICDCGNEYIGAQADIVSGHTQSCGCLQKEMASQSNTKDWTGVVSAHGIKFLSQDCMNDKGQWLWKCRCGVCGNEFVALPARINNEHITSCGCASKSSGERMVESVLRELQVEFREQYLIPECKYKHTLRFDFAVFHKDRLLYLIEYDGRQHFEPVDLFGGEVEFADLQKRDEIKNQYCHNHNIPLLRLPYTLSTNEINQIIYEYHLSVTTAGCA